mgnify:CR=1 FL=1
MVEEENNLTDRLEEKILEEVPLVDTEESRNKEEKKIEIEAPEIEEGKYVEEIGRRKESVARVRIWRNTTKEALPIYVNGKFYTEYFPLLYLQKTVDAPLRKLRLFGHYLVTVKVKGGGLHGQADAIKLGLARALVKLNQEWRPKLKKAGYLTRDPREVERKKYGLKKARRAPQWHKR